MTTSILQIGAKTERADCTVKAVSVCLSIPYNEAHARLSELGRKPRCRFKLWSVVDDLGLERRPEFACRSLKSVLPELPPRCIVRHARHVFAVVDGVPHDWREVSENLRIKMVYAPKPLSCPVCGGVDFTVKRFFRPGGEEEFSAELVCWCGDYASPRCHTLAEAEQCVRLGMRSALD